MLNPNRKKQYVSKLILTNSLLQIKHFGVSRFSYGVSSFGTTRGCAINHRLTHQQDKNNHRHRLIHRVANQSEMSHSWINHLLMVAT